LKIAGWIQAMAKIGLDSHACGIPTFDHEGADVSGPVTAYAVPSMMGLKFIGKATGKIVRLSDIFRVPKSIGPSGENIDTGQCEILRPDWVKPESV
jgi:hypothetical protein